MQAPENKRDYARDNGAQGGGAAEHEIASGVLADFLPYLLSITSNAVSSRIADEYSARFGLKIAEWRVMAVLGEAGPLTQRQLTSLTLMDKVAVNRACKALEERALVERLPNESDGRSHHLLLTPAGHDIYAEIMPLALGMEAQMFRIFSEEEVAMFRSLLQRLHRQIGNIDPEKLSGNLIPG